MASPADPDRDVSCRVGACADLGRDAARSAQAPTLQERADHRSALLLWLSVAGGFLILACAWFFLIRAAREANVESVPLATPGGKP